MLGLGRLGHGRFDVLNFLANGRQGGRDGGRVNSLRGVLVGLVEEAVEEVECLLRQLGNIAALGGGRGGLGGDGEEGLGEGIIPRVGEDTQLWPCLLQLGLELAVTLGEHDQGGLELFVSQGQGLSLLALAFSGGLGGAAITQNALHTALLFFVLCLCSFSGGGLATG